MVESILHKSLVVAIQEWVKSSFSEEMIIYIDSENSTLLKNMPSQINGHIPDIYAMGRRINRIIIGEAKTSQCDLESEHSEGQILSYLKHCVNKQDSIVVLAVPLHLINCAKSIISSLKRRNNLETVKTIVLNPLLTNKLTCN
jgi:hypothetical protein